MINFSEGKVIFLFLGWKVRPDKYRNRVPSTVVCILSGVGCHEWPGGCGLEEGCERGNYLHTVGLEWIWVEEFCREDRNERKGKRKHKISFPWLGEGDRTGATDVNTCVSRSDLSCAWGQGGADLGMKQVKQGHMARGRKWRGSWRLGK